MSKTREPHALVKSLIALALVALCFWAAQWQYNRGVDRHARNYLIETHTSLPKVSLDKIASHAEPQEWRTVTVSGKFDTSKQILLRNHYTDEGEYGFELLTAFTSDSGKTFWVDCGWVKAPPTAIEKPNLPDLPTSHISIVGRLRLNHSLPEGSYFAISKAGESSLIRAANAQAGHDGINSPFYLDLISGDQASLTPEVPAALPELSDGPHMAYAIQWLFFGSLVIYGRFLIRREHFRALS